MQLKYFYFRLTSEKGDDKGFIKNGAGNYPFRLCEYIGGPNLAKNRPLFSKEDEDSSCCNIKYVNDGSFQPANQYFGNQFWHGAGDWVYLQITLDKFYAVKTIIFQTR